MGEFQGLGGDGGDICLCDGAGAVAGLALVVAACGGGTEYQTADAVKAFNADQDNAKYGIALACPETVPADTEFECTFSTKGGTPQKATFVIEQDELAPTDEQAMGQAMLDATTPQFWGDNTLPGIVDSINADPIVKAADLQLLTSSSTFGPGVTTAYLHSWRHGTAGAKQRVEAR